MNFKQLLGTVLATISLNVFAATYNTTATYLPSDELYQCGMNSDNELVYPSGESKCAIHPSYFGVKVYKLKLCTALPGTPTTSTLPDFTNCVDVFENTEGSLVEAREGEFSPLVGTLTRPPNGTYDYYFLEYDKSLLYKAAFQFQSARRDSDGNDGVYCATKAGTNRLSEIQTENSSSTCSNTEITNPGLYNFTRDTYTYTPGDPFESTDEDLSINTKLWLLDSNGYLAADENDVKTQAQSFTLASTAIVTDDTTQVRIKFGVENALMVQRSAGVAVSGTGTVYLDEGPFDLVVSVH